jgi:hypothetical protein
VLQLQCKQAGVKGKSGVGEHTCTLLQMPQQQRLLLMLSWRGWLHRMWESARCQQLCKHLYISFYIAPLRPCVSNGWMITTNSVQEQCML